VKAKFPTNQKARSLEQQQIAKPIFCDAARQENYLFWDSEKFLAHGMRNISPELSVW